MINLIMVEDDAEAAATMRRHIERFSAETGEQFEVSVYGDALSFFASYRTDTDIVLMDIELPDMDGMTASARLRAMDKVVTIIFVTNMAQYAIKGYSVGALDFLVKPVTYYGFSTMMSRAVSSLGATRDKVISVRTGTGLCRVSVSEVLYIEVRDHKLIYRTNAGAVESWGSLRELSVSLAPYGFARGNSCYLINLRKVTAIDGGDVTVGGFKLRLSRSRRTEFMRALAEYLSGAGGGEN